MRKVHGIFSRLIAEKEIIDLRSTRATRCVYESEDIQRVEMQLETVAGECITFSMNSRQTAELIEKLTHCYFAINPELRTRRTGIG